MGGKGRRIDTEEMMQCWEVVGNGQDSLKVVSLGWLDIGL